VTNTLAYYRLVTNSLMAQANEKGKIGANVFKTKKINLATLVRKQGQVGLKIFRSKTIRPKDIWPTVTKHRPVGEMLCRPIGFSQNLTIFSIKIFES
jgi:hypothetical protein